MFWKYDKNPLEKYVIALWNLTTPRRLKYVLRESALDLSSVTWQTYHSGHGSIVSGLCGHRLSCYPHWSTGWKSAAIWHLLVEPWLRVLLTASFRVMLLQITSRITLPDLLITSRKMFFVVKQYRSKQTNTTDVSRPGSALGSMLRWLDCMWEMAFTRQPPLSMVSDFDGLRRYQGSCKDLLGCFSQIFTTSWINQIYLVTQKTQKVSYLSQSLRRRSVSEFAAFQIISSIKLKAR